jgi:hypothetical protein
VSHRLGLALAITLAALAPLARAAPPRAPAVARAVAAGVPAPLADDLAARAAEHGLDPAEALAPAAEAARAGLPAELVVEKTLEGLAKGVPPARTLAVARALTDRLAGAAATLTEARRAGLALTGSRPAALADVAGALADGVTAEALRDLVDSARRGREGSADSVVAAARTLGELGRRGVAVPEGLPLARALAGSGARPEPGGLAALYDAYRSEGGREPGAFLEEARRRVEAGAPLDGMVDYFAEGTDGVVRLDGKGKGKDGGVGVGNGKRANAGEVPGLSDGPPGRGKPKKDKAK